MTLYDIRCHTKSKAINNIVLADPAKVMEAALSWAELPDTEAVVIWSGGTKVAEYNPRRYQRDQLRQSALSKLTADERTALGV